MRVLYLMGGCWLAAMLFLWGGRFGRISRKIALIAAIVCILAGSGVLAAAVYPRGNGFGETVNSLTDLGNRNRPDKENTKKYLALTFDDGPYPPYTVHLLDILKEKGVHVTFFLVASQAQLHPELVCRMAAEGHTVALHAFRHRDFLRLTGGEKENDLSQGKQILRSITGRDPLFWRPPHGFRDFSAMETASSQKLKVVNWSVIPRDWTGIGKQEIYNRVMEQAEDSAIVLLHDGDSPFYRASRQATVDAVAPLIDSLRQKGYHLVSLEEYEENRRVEGGW